ncbi:MAG: DUF305 domain-containing protein [Bacteroidota bacterium]
MTVRVVPALLLAAALASGCSQTAPLDTPPPPAPTTTAPDAEPAPEASGDDRSDLEALYWERIEASRTYTQADVDYMTGMIGHHAQALLMSEMAMRNDASPAVKRLAARIDNAQKDEIESMQRWLRQRGQPYPVPTFEGTVMTLTMVAPDDTPQASGAMDHGSMDHGEMDHSGMDHADHDGMDHSEMDHSQHAGMDHGAMGHGGHDHSMMPGMLTQAQLDELDAARGVTFDRLFLRYMIAHHGGAVTMTDDLFAQDGAAQDDTAFKLASDIQVDQRTEIARMQTMLDRITD